MLGIDLDFDVIDVALATNVCTMMMRRYFLSAGVIIMVLRVVAYHTTSLVALQSSV